MSRETKSHVFRIRGLPKSWGEKKNTTRLRQAIDQELSENEKQTLEYTVEIVPDCYDEDHKMVALVEFTGASPAFLFKLIDEVGHYVVLYFGKHELTIDRDFFQLTQLNHPKCGPSYSADIIAITGLDGHAYGSWRGKRSGRMWLRDYLTRDFPTCRIMMYGYNTKLTVRSTANLEDYSAELLDELKSVRRARQKSWKDQFRSPDNSMLERPIIFIAHSFGGLVVARALTLCANPPWIQKEWKPLYNAIYAILFFGVPHKGLLTSDILKIIQSQQGARSHPRRKLLKSIELGSEELTKQLEAFSSVVQHRRIATFHELLQTPSLEWDSVAKRFQRSGDPSSAVAKESAILHFKKTEATVGLHADHSSIVKFESENEQGYRHTVHWIREFVRNGCVVARFMCMKRYSGSQYPPLASSWTSYRILTSHNIKCGEPQTFDKTMDKFVDDSIDFTDRFYNFVARIGK